MTGHDEETLTAYLDGMLDPSDRRELETRLDGEYELSRRLLVLARREALLAEVTREEDALRRMLPRPARGGRIGLLIALSSLAAAGIVVLSWPGGNPPPAAAPQSERPEVSDLVRRFVDAKETGDMARLRRLEDDILEQGGEARSAVRELLEESARKLGPSMGEAAGEIARWYANGEPFPEIADLGPSRKRLLLEWSGLQYLRFKLDLAERWARGEWTFVEADRTLVTFEHMAARGHWDRASKCLERADEEAARAFYDAFREAAAAAGSGLMTFTNVPLPDRPDVRLVVLTLRTLFRYRVEKDDFVSPEAIGVAVLSRRSADGPFVIRRIEFGTRVMISR